MDGFLGVAAAAGFLAAGFFVGLALRRARAAAEVAIHVDSINYGVVEDLHQSVMHALAQYIRQSRMTAGAIEATVF